MSAPTSGQTELSSVESSPVRPTAWLAFFGLVLMLGLFIYHPVRQFEFLNFDDNYYVNGNPWLKQGLTWQSVRWAFAANLTEFSKNAEYWSPITLLSRLLDAQLYGVSAGPFHVTSAALHLFNTALLAFALWRLTGKWGRSAAVALLFLVHPLNVEPVCWLSARKDLLSGTFLFATLLAYANYVRKQNTSSYLLLLAAYAAALMSKPMGMSTPFLLLLLDWWPLRRWPTANGQRADWLRLIAEKIPLLILACIAALLAYLSQKDWGALGAGAAYSMPVRIENALVSYTVYFRRIFWPSDLTLFYPHPGSSLPLWAVVIASIFLVAVTCIAFALRRRAPYLLAGWFWFGLALGPVIGLVQIGAQSMADRYSYPSIIGIFIALVWGAGEILRTKPQLARGLAAAALAGFAICSSIQALTFRNSEIAFRRAIAVTKDNETAYLNLGVALFGKGDFQGAKENDLQVIRVDPANPSGWGNLALAESRLGQEDEAIGHYQKSLELDPNNVISLLFLGEILARRGRNEEAEPLFIRLRELEPQKLQPLAELTKLYTAQARWDDAVRVWATYVAAHQGDVIGRQQLEAALARKRAAR